MSDGSEMDGARVARGEGAPALAGVLASLALSTLLPSLGISIANVALPTLAEAFGASFREVQWVVLAYLLATTTLVVSAGRLGDLVGRRRLLLAGIALHAAASALCGLAPGLGGLIAARAVQGLGAAVMMALAMAFVADAVPKSRTGTAMGLLGTMSAVGTALGPSLGGVLIAGFGWRAVFLAGVPLGLLALGLAWRFLPADRAPARAGRAAFDGVGTLLLVLTLGAYALAMTLGRSGFGALNLGLLAAAALGGWLFVRTEGRVAAPLVRLARLRDPGLAAGLATSALVSTVMMATLVVGPFYLAHALGLDAARVGALMSIGPLVSALGGVPAGRLVDRAGPRRALLGGLAGLAAGCVALALWPGAPGIVGYLLPIVGMTASYATFQAANNTVVMANVSADQRGVVSGLLNLARNLGLITGASVMALVFASAVGAADFASADPAALASGMHTAFTVAAGLMLLALVVVVSSARRPRAATA